MTPDPKVELMAAKLEAIKAHQTRELNRVLYFDGLGLKPTAAPPIRWWTRVYGRVRGYLLNLWDALCGRMPPESEDW